MSIFINCTNDAGKLCFTYMKQNNKYKLCRLNYRSDDKIKNIALDKVWVNGFPSWEIKKFNSTILDEGTLFILYKNGEVNLITDKFAAIPLLIEFIGKNTSTLSLNVPEKLTVEGLKIALAKKIEGISFKLEKDDRTLDSGYEMGDFGFEPEEKIVAKDIKWEEFVSIKDSYRLFYDFLISFVKDHPDFEKNLNNAFRALKLKNFYVEHPQTPTHLATPHSQFKIFIDNFCKNYSGLIRFLEKNPTYQTEVNELLEKVNFS